MFSTESLMLTEWVLRAGLREMPKQFSLGFLRVFELSSVSFTQKTILDQPEVNGILGLFTEELTVALSKFTLSNTLLLSLSISLQVCQTSPVFTILSVKAFSTSSS